MGERRYKSTLVDKHGPLVVETLGRGIFGGLVVGLLVVIALRANGTSFVPALLIGLGVAAAGALLVIALTTGAMHLTGSAATRMLEGSSEYHRDYSRHDALAISGRIPEALMLYEEEIANDAAASEPRFRAAELYLQQQNPTRAIELLRQVQRAANVRQEDDVRASYRLMDIYQGAQRDDGRLLVELRRLVDRYPNVPAAARWRSAIAEIQKSRA